MAKKSDPIDRSLRLNKGDGTITLQQYRRFRDEEDDPIHVIEYVGSPTKRGT